MTKKKKLKVLVRGAAARTGESYTRARARLLGRREGRLTAADVEERWSRLHALILAAAVEFEAEAKRVGGVYQASGRPRWDGDRILRPRKSELLDALVALSAEELFFVQVVFFLGKSAVRAKEVIEDAHRYNEDSGPDAVIDYIFRKMPGTERFFRDGLARAVRASLSLERCWSERQRLLEGVGGIGASTNEGAGLSNAAR